MQVVHVVDALLFDQLLHLGEDGQVLLVEVALVEPEVLVVKIEALVLLVDLLGEALAEILDLLVQREHLVLVTQLTLLGAVVGLIARHVRHVERLCWLLESGKEIVRGLGPCNLLGLIPRLRSTLCVLREALFAKVPALLATRGVIVSGHARLEDHFKTWVRLALLRDAALRPNNLHRLLHLVRASHLQPTT